MKTQNMKARVMGGAGRCIEGDTRKFQNNPDTATLALSVFTMPGPRHCGGVIKARIQSAPFGVFVGKPPEPPNPFRKF
jgi:hypothetical protein